MSRSRRPISIWCNEEGCFRFAQTQDPTVTDERLRKCREHAAALGGREDHLPPAPEAAPIAPSTPPPPAPAPTSEHPPKRKGTKKCKPVRRRSDGAVFASAAIAAQAVGIHVQRIWNSIHLHTTVAGTKWDYVTADPPKAAPPAETFAPLPAPAPRPLTTELEIERMEGEGPAGVPPASHKAPDPYTAAPSEHPDVWRDVLKDIQTMKNNIPNLPAPVKCLPDALIRATTSSAFFLETRRIAAAIAQTATHAHEHSSLTDRKWIRNLHELLAQAEYALDQHAANQ